MDDQLPSAPELEARARRAGLSIAEMCRRTSTALTTFFRWKSGHASPTIATVQKWLDAVCDAEKQSAK